MVEILISKQAWILLHEEKTDRITPWQLPNKQSQLQQN